MCQGSASSPMRCALRSRRSSPAATRPKRLRRPCRAAGADWQNLRDRERSSGRDGLRRVGRIAIRGIASAPEWLARAAGSTTGSARTALEHTRGGRGMSRRQRRTARGRVVARAGRRDRAAARARHRAVGNREARESCGRSRIMLGSSGSRRWTPRRFIPATRTTRGSPLGRRRAGHGALRGRVLTRVREALRASPRPRDRPGLARGAARETDGHSRLNARRTRSSACSAALPPPKPAPPI